MYLSLFDTKIKVDDRKNLREGQQVCVKGSLVQVMKEDIATGYDCDKVEKDILQLSSTL